MNVSTETGIIPASATGRYLMRVPDSKPLRILIGFHGYGENAEVMLERLVSIPGSGECVIASIQGLHWFYNTKTGEVVSNWMTKLERDQAIENNMDYVGRVIAELRQRFPPIPLSLIGFSQGCAMAWRAAAAIPSESLVLLGGDIPPELDLSMVRSRILIGRGERDEWYTEAKLEDDRKRVATSGIPLEVFSFAAGHEWNETFARKAAEFIFGEP